MRSQGCQRRASVSLRIVMAALSSRTPPVCSSVAGPGVRGVGADDLPSAASRHGRRNLARQRDRLSELSVSLKTSGKSSIRLAFTESKRSSLITDFTQNLVSDASATGSRYTGSNYEDSTPKA